MTTISPEQLKLEIGDIIQINSPTNPEYNGKIFLIQFLDTTKMKLLNDITFEVKQLNFEDGILTDESITAISILSKPILKGYALQNGLITRTWLDIHFGGEFPTVITGEITNLEEDMIELTTYPDGNVIYIDFAYGIPEDLPIVKIDIRNPPIVKEVTTETVFDDKLPIIKEGEILDDKKVIDDEEDDIEGIPTPIGIPFKEIKKKITDILVEADDFSFGDRLGTITQEITVEEHERRYNINEQTTDMLNELLTKIPNIDRSTKVLNNLNRIITRFKQVRKQFSTMDKRGVVTGIIKHKHNYKPLVEKLYSLSCNLSWLLPVVKNKKKLYNLNDVTAEDTPDIVSITMDDAITNQNEVINMYYSNKTTEGDNKYKKLIKDLNPLFTPFERPDEMDDILHKQEVNKNIETIIDNIEDDLVGMYTSISKNHTIKKRRFVITRYNLGIKQRKTNYKNFKNSTIITPITKSDTAYVNSFIMLPEPFVRYSHINLPNTTIYEKASLNQTSLAYWKLLRKDTSITTDMVNTLDRDYTYSPDTFLQEIKQVALNDDITDDDKYRKFIQAFVPQTRVLFELIKKYIENKTNYTSIIEYLEPFLIYKEDLTFMQYNTIVEFINTNIQKLMAHISSNTKYTNLLRNWRVKIGFNSSILLTMLGKLNYGSHSVSEAYNLKASTLPSECYADIITTDYGRLYTSSISLLDASLYSDINIPEKLSEKVDLLSLKMNELRDDTTKEKCGDKILAKHYIELDELTDDNEKEAYFDKKYDTTRYDIINEYKTQQETMSEEEFIAYLTRQIQMNIGMSLQDATIEATSIIRGQRAVGEGNYSLLETLDGEGNNIYYYYKRVDNNWVLDESIVVNNLIESEKYFCNSHKKCLMVKNTCNTTKEARIKLDSDITKNIIKSIMDEHIFNSEQMKEKITVEQQENSRMIERIKELIIQQTLQYNKEQYNIGLEAEYVESQQSPYMRLRNLILGQQNIIQRNINLQKFVLKCTRTAITEGESMEDENWLYCTKTNIKLLPSFYAKLANTTQENYQSVIDDICKERGVISDDGNKWVDKYSGYTIRFIDFDTDEGYDDMGFKIQTHSAVEQDLSTKVSALSAIIPSSKEEESKETRYINNIITSLSESMGITIEGEREFILRNTLIIVNKVHGDKVTYNKKRKIMAAKKKKMVSYDLKLNQYLLYFTGLFFLFAIQTSTPSITTKKTYPNCKKSFSGFPFEEMGDTSGLEYVACIMKRTTGGSNPWNSIRKLKEESLLKNMKILYKKYISDLPIIQQRILKKEEYTETHLDTDDIPYSISVGRWTSFLPPLIKLNVEEPRYINDLFRSELNRHLQSGNIKQYEEIDILKSKMLFYALTIQQEINKIVEKEPTILKSKGSGYNEPFLENVCCLTTDNHSALSYFERKNKSITEHNKRIYELSALYNNILNLTNAPFLYSNATTKLLYPQIAYEFSESTIYQGFIHFCKINKYQPVPVNLQKYCLENTSDFKLTDTLEERIRILKSEGKHYSREAFLQLLNEVNRGRIIHINTDIITHSVKQKLEDLLLYFNTSDNHINIKLEEHLTALLDTFSFEKPKDSPTYDALIDYIIPHNEELTLYIKEFINTNANTSSKNKTSWVNYIDTFNQFLPHESTILNTSEDITTLYSIQYIKNCVYQMINDFPNMILNQVSFSDVKIPPYWNLSKLHNIDIKTIIISSIKALGHNYSLEKIRPVLVRIQEEGSLLIKLMENIPFMLSYKHGDVVIKSLFDYELVMNLYIFIFLQTINLYIKYTASILDDIPIDEEEFEFETMAELRETEKSDLREKIGNLIGDYITILQYHKKTINYNNKFIKNKILQVKDTEKDRKTRYLKDLTEEERWVDTEFKRAGLGRWGKGHQKGLTQYDPKTQDEERHEMEQEAIKDLELNNMTGVVDMNREIFRFSLLEQKQQDKEIEREINSMSHLPDDDDFGERDGDE